MREMVEVQHTASLVRPSPSPRTPESLVQHALHIHYPAPKKNDIAAPLLNRLPQASIRHVDRPEASHLCFGRRCLAAYLESDQEDNSSSDDECPPGCFPAQTVNSLFTICYVPAS